MKTAELIYSKYKELIPGIDHELKLSNVQSLVESSDDYVINIDDVVEAERCLVKVLIEVINDLVESKEKK